MEPSRKNDRKSYFDPWIILTSLCEFFCPARLYRIIRAVNCSFSARDNDAPWVFVVRIIKAIFFLPTIPLQFAKTRNAAFKVLACVPVWRSRVDYADVKVGGILLDSIFLNGYSDLRYFVNLLIYRGRLIRHPII